MKLTPDIAGNNVNAKICLANVSQRNNLKMKIHVEGINHNLKVADYVHTEISDTLEVSIPMGEDYKMWSEFSPHLYQMTLTLENEDEIIDTREEVFGMRDFSIQGYRFTINGIPIFLRGTTECCVFPLTGYPPTDELEWAEIFDKCKEYGLNHMRFHSYCPPEAAFNAADKAGIYLQVEGPSWAKYSVTLGDGKPIDQYLMDETKRIIDVYGNHPSFCMMAYGNEPSGHYVGYLENWVDHFRKYDPQRVFTGASTGRSWSIIENSDFIVRSPPRGLNWMDEQPQNMFDYRNNTENQNRPYVTFEMGQWCAFPDFKEIPLYKGPLKARNFELFREELDKHHMGYQSEDFLMASGKLQASCYKQEIEATLRTPNLAGFQLLSLNDFSGQGTALVGVLNAFWKEKGYIDGKEFSQFCNSIVPLVRMPAYTYEISDTLKAAVELANFSGEKILNAAVTWQLLNEESLILKSGSFNDKNIPVGNCNHIGEINLPLNFIDKAQKFTLVVSVENYSNQWNIWVYAPRLMNQVHDIYISETLDKKCIQRLEEGKKVLLLASGKVENGKEVSQFFTPVFWNSSWYRMRPPHTTGVLINEKHPVFNDFPTDYHSDFQWWELVNNQQVMNVDLFLPDFDAIVQPIDTWFLNRRLAMLFEAKVLNGRLMVCSIDLESDLNNRIVARQLKQSILNYMQSDLFNPEQEIEPELIQELFEVKGRKVWNSYVKNNP